MPNDDLKKLPVERKTEFPTSQRSVALLQRRLEIWQGARPRIEHAHQQEQQAEALLQHEITHEHTQELEQVSEPTALVSDSTESLDCKGFQDAVISGKITLPDIILQKFRNCRDYFSQTDPSEPLIKLVRKELESIWDTWLGHVPEEDQREEYPHWHALKSWHASQPRNYPYENLIFPDINRFNPLVKKIKLSAIQQLLKHYKQSQWGFDYEQPPEGFILQGTVLNFVPGLRIPQSRTRVEVTFSDKKFEQKEIKNSYPGMAGEWWVHLSQVHRKHNPQDNFAEVQRAFQSFLDYLDQHGLQLPPPSFNQDVNNIKSLPLALGRIVALLNNCSRQNRQQQLNVVPYLDLGNTGAIRAIREPRYLSHGHYRYNKCQFVVPGMNCSVKNFGKYHGYLTYQSSQVSDNKNIYTSNRVINIYKSYMEYFPKQFGADKNIEKHKLAAINGAKETFWRYIAHTDSMPLSFYLDSDEAGNPRPGAVARIEEFKNPEIKAHLYCLLAKLSTGPAALNNPCPTKMLQHWHKVCDLFKLMAKNPALAIEGLETLHLFSVAPPLYLLDKIIVLCSKWARNPLRINLVPQSFKRLDKLLQFLHPDPARLYHGMRHCQRDYKGEDPFLNTTNSLFIEFLNKFEKIHQECKGAKGLANQNAISFLFQSLDTFALKESDIKGCVKAIKESPELEAKGHPLFAINDFSPFQKNCIDLLNQMILVNYEKLSIDHFNRFIEKIREIYCDTKLAYTGPKTVAFITYLQQNYANNFPQNFLLEKKIFYQNQLHESVRDEIKKLPLEQRRLAKRLMGLHSSAALGVQFCFIQALQNLSTMCTSYDFNLTDCLARLFEYEKANDRVPKQHNLEDLSKFFTLITNENNIDPFESLLYQPGMEKVPQLIQKGIILYETISPWLSLHQGEISQQLSYGPACDVFLASPVTEFSGDVKAIEPIVDKQVETLATVLEDKTATIELLSTKVNALLFNTIYCQDKNLIQAWQLLRADEEKKDHAPPLSEVKEKSFDKKEQEKVAFASLKPLTMVERIKEYAAKKAMQFKTALVDPMVGMVKLRENLKPKPISPPALPDIPSCDIGLQRAKNELHQFIKNAKQYRYFILNYYNDIYALIKTYPKLKIDLLKYIGHFAKQLKMGPSQSYVAILREQLTYLQSAATFFADETAFRDVLYHAHHQEKPGELIEYFKIINHHIVESTRKHEFYKLFAKLYGESIITGPAGAEQKRTPIITHSSFEKLCESCKLDAGSEKLIFKFYANPPYPVLEKVLEPYQADRDIKEANEMVAANFAQHDQQPYRPDPKNAFNFAKAKKQAMLFSNNYLFPNEVLEKLDNRIRYYRGLSTSAKIQHLAAIKDSLKNIHESKSPLTDIADLTALLSELLFCTANQEFDYTQVLALYSQLACKDKAVHQISTGRGKSRIAMGLCAGRLLMGEDPDFATDTMKLAEEAYHTTKPFFKACGIDTLLLDVATPLADYYPDNKKSIISFSSRDQLGLFHNRLQSEKHDYPAKQNPVLIIDEGDKFYADLGKLHLNLAAHDPDPTHDFSWTYEYLYQFTKENNFYAYYINDNLTEVYQQLINYIKERNPGTLQDRFDNFRRFATSHQATIEIWLRAALTARSLREGIDFDATIAQDVPILTPSGMRIASKALVKIDNLVSHHSIFSDAVQQFLHVRLNHERAQERASSTGKKISNTPYHIAPLSYVTFSSTAYSLLNRYKKWFGLTGSSGSPLVQHEMRQRFKGLEFIDVPDHQPSQRIDLMAQIVKDRKQQIATFKKYHQRSVARNRPHIIISKNDKESEEVRAALATTQLGTVQQLDGTLQNYDAILRQAGEGRTTTSGTGVLGRGVDVKIAPTANQTQGMAVTVADVPSTTEKTQDFGRAARRDKPGTAQLLIDFEKLRKEFSLPDTIEDEKLIDLFLNRDDFIKRLHLQVDKAEQYTRCTNILIIDFFDHLFKDYAQRKSAITEEKWASFLNRLNEKIKNPSTDAINKLLEKKPLAIEQIIEEIQSLFGKTTAYYNTFLTKKIKLRGEFVPPVYDYEILRAQLSTSDLKALDIPVSRTTYAEYDEAHAGCNVVYHSLFVRSRWALKQLWARELSLSEIFFQHQNAAADQLGLPHPEWKAYWSGKRQLFANTRAFFRGNLNQEWQQYEKAYIKLDMYAKNEANEKAPAAQAVLAAVKQQAAQIGNKKELVLLTQVLHQTHQVMTVPCDTTHTNYQELMAEVAHYKKWESIKNAMTLALGVTFLLGFAALMVFSHGLAAPIAFYGIKLSLSLITGAAYSLLGVGTVLSTAGLFAMGTSSTQAVVDAVNQPAICPAKKA